MRLRLRLLAAPAACVLLAACAGGGGGGGGGGTGGGGNGGNGGGPIVTGPAPTNSSLTGTLVSESFANNASTGGLTVLSNGGIRVDGASQTAATIAYDAAADSYVVTIDGRSQTFARANLDSGKSTATLTVYVKKNGSTTDTLTITKAGTSGRFTYQYVGGAFWQRTREDPSNAGGAFDAIVYGVKTPDGAVPRTGVAEYVVDLTAVQTRSGGIYGITGEGKAQIDFASGAVVVHGTAVSPLPTLSTFSSEARLSSTANAFTGVFRLVNGSDEYAGSLDGRLYGPAAQEIGGSFSATMKGAFGTTDVVVGSLTGRGGPVSAGNSSIKTPTVNEFLANDAVVLKTTLQGASGSNHAGQTFSGGGAQASPLIVNYDADLRAYSLIAPDRSQSFTTVRLFGVDGEALVDTGSVEWGYPYGGYVSPQYVVAKRWKAAASVSGGVQYRFEEFTAGIRTPDAALPRTGSANYKIGVSGTAADGDFANLTRISGYGVLAANFATGKLTAEARLALTEDYFSALASAGALSATGSISSSANSFNGSISLEGLGAYSGTFNGRFYGPQAQELGAAFSASDGAGGVAAGTIVGVVDPTPPPSAATLATLSTRTDMTVVKGGYYTPAISELSGVAYDPATQTYTVSFSNYPGAPVATLALGAGTANAGAGAAGQAAYAGQISGLSYTALLLRQGAANPTLALSYSNLAAISVAGGDADPRMGRYFAAFGLPTAPQNMPLTGRGEYAGVVAGVGKVQTNYYLANASSVTSLYDLKGTFNLSADFLNSRFSAKIDLTGTDMDTGATKTFAPLNSTGGVTGSTFAGAGDFHSVMGQFYGPRAEEVGGMFDYLGVDQADTRTELRGAMVGKR